MFRNSVAMTAILGTIAGSIMVLRVEAGADKVVFPENYAQGVMYMTINRPVRPNASVAGGENSAQFREHYVTLPAIEALRSGQPFPSGTVVTMIQYRAQLDAQGNPLTDANGRFMKADLIGFGVMEKRTGWGAEYAPDIRNGEWEYQHFGPDRKPNPNMKLTACFQCHRSQAAKDFLHSFDQLSAFANK